MAARDPNSRLEQSIDARGWNLILARVFPAFARFCIVTAGFGLPTSVLAQALNAHD
jgi:hypothetical protein